MPTVDYAPDPRVEPVTYSHRDSGTVGLVPTAAQIAEEQQQEKLTSPPAPAGSLQPPTIDYDPTTPPGVETPHRVVIDHEPDIDVEIAELESRLVTLRGKLEAQLADVKARKAAQEQERTYPPRTINTGVPVYIADPPQKENADGGQIRERAAGDAGITQEQALPDAEHGEGVLAHRAGGGQEPRLAQGADSGQHGEQGHQQPQSVDDFGYPRQEEQPQVPGDTGP